MASRKENEELLRRIFGTKTSLPTAGNYGGEGKASIGRAGEKSIWDRLKQVGSTTLDALSVPQAAVFTGIQKGAHHLAGTDDVSWKNLGGRFYKGYKGGAGLLNSLGVENEKVKKWAGLGLDLAADPLWFVAPAAVAKAGKAKQLVSAGDDVFKAANITRTAASKMDDAQKAAFVRSIREDLGQVLPAKKPVKFKSARNVKNAGKDKSRKEMSKRRRAAFVAASQENYGRNAMRRLRAKSGATPKSSAGVFSERAETDVMDSLRRAFGKDDAEAMVRGMQKAATSQSVARHSNKSKVFRAKPRKVTSGYQPPPNQALARALRGLDKPGPAPKQWENVDEYGMLINPAEIVREHGKGLARIIEKPERDVVIRFGTKKRGVNVKTGKTLKAKTIKKERTKKFRMVPGVDFAHQYRRFAEETGAGERLAASRLPQRLGLADDPAVIDRISQVANAGTLGEQTKLVERFRARGVWDETHDKALDYLQNKMHEYGVGEGFGTAAQRIAKLRDAAGKAAADTQKVQDQLYNLVQRGVSKRDHRYVSLDKQREKLQLAQDEALRKLEVAENRAPYFAHTMTDQTEQNVADFYQKAFRSGDMAAPDKYRRGRIKNSDPNRQRRFETQYDGVTEEQFRAQFANQPADELDEVIDLMRPRFAQSEQRVGKTPVGYAPEWNPFKVLGERSAKGILNTVEKEIDQALRARGVLPGTELYDSIERSVYNAADPASLHFRGGDRLQNAMSVLKGVYTTINPAHFVNNAIGDYINRLVTGNFRHIGTTASIPRSKMWKLANGDPEMLKASFDIGNGVKMTGEQIVAQAHIASLGRGFVTAEVRDQVIGTTGAIRRWMIDGKNPMAVMGRLNTRRENAQRLETWLKHIRSGDDPLTAAEKTLKVHFDYGRLTPFEQTWMRNMFLFYTWMKRNSLLHMHGLLTRPALYNAYGNLERNRTKFENEPEWYSKMGAVTLPFIGNLAFNNPMNDIHRWTAGGDSARQNVLSAINPFVRVPAELMTNQRFYTGSDIESYEGQRRPNWLAALLRMQESSVKAGGDKAPSMPAKWDYLLSQLGPFSNNMTAGVQPDQDEVNKWVDAFGRALGPKIQQNLPEKFARSEKYRQAKKKADATRARNAQGG